MRERTYGALAPRVGEVPLDGLHRAARGLRFPKAAAICNVRQGLLEADSRIGHRMMRMGRVGRPVNVYLMPHAAFNFACASSIHPWISVLLIRELNSPLNFFISASTTASTALLKAFLSLS